MYGIIQKVADEKKYFFKTNNKKIQKNPKNA